MPMLKKVLVVGAGSFIARQWTTTAGKHISFVRHNALNAGAVKQCDVVVNCAMSPVFKSSAYQEGEDCDLAAARLAAESGKHFVMLGTRKVYQPSNTTKLLDETSALGPQDYYGQNKLYSEEKITSLLGEHCTILRIANVYGYELGRRSFFGLAMTKLREQRVISLDVSPFVERDFIAVEKLIELLDLICQNQSAGIFNVGSGCPLQLGRIAQWLIEGYGLGSLIVSDVKERDGFVMDTAKLKKALKADVSQINFKDHIKKIGNQLLHE